MSILGEYRHLERDMEVVKVKIMGYDAALTSIYSKLDALASADLVNTSNIVANTSAITTNTSDIAASAIADAARDNAISVLQTQVSNLEDDVNTLNSEISPLLTPDSDDDAASTAPIDSDSSGS